MPWATENVESAVFASSHWRFGPAIPQFSEKIQKIKELVGKDEEYELLEVKELKQQDSEHKSNEAETA